MNNNKIDEDEALLEQLYHNIENPDEPGALGSVDKLFSAANNKKRPLQIPITVVKEYLSKQEVYRKHKPAVRRAVRRNRMISKGVGRDFQTDLADMQMFADSNDGYRYILCVIDIFSKMAYCSAIKKKSGEVVRDAFEAMAKLAPELYGSSEQSTVMASDAGKEYMNESVQAWFQ